MVFSHGRRRQHHNIKSYHSVEHMFLFPHDEKKNSIQPVMGGGVSRNVDTQQHMGVIALCILSTHRGEN